MGQCEYNPITHEAAYTPPNPGDCTNKATVSVGKGKWHLCQSCAELSEFKRYKKKLLLGRLLRAEQEPDMVHGEEAAS